MTYYQERVAKDIGILAMGALFFVGLFLMVRGCGSAQVADTKARIAACVEGRQWEACSDCAGIEVRSADVCRDILAQLSQERSGKK